MSAKIKNLGKIYKNEENKVEENNLVNEIINNEVDYSGSTTDIVQGITPEQLEEFKSQVKLWLELDTVVKRLQTAIKDRKKMMSELHDKIIKFMIMNHIDDLNTKSGTIRYKTTQVKAPLSQKQIKEKLTQTFEKNTDVVDRINEIFDNREVKEKKSLRKIKF